MAPMACTVQYDEMITSAVGIEYDPPRRVLWSNGDYIPQSRLCCKSMKNAYEGFVHGDEREREGGMALCVVWHSYGESYQEVLSVCPFCGARIEYDKRQTIKYVQSSEPTWTPVEVGHD